MGPRLSLKGNWPAHEREFQGIPRSPCSGCCSPAPGAALRCRLQPGTQAASAAKTSGFHPSTASTPPSSTSLAQTGIQESPGPAACPHSTSLPLPLPVALWSRKDRLATSSSSLEETSSKAYSLSSWGSSPPLDCNLYLISFKLLNNFPEHCFTDVEMKPLRGKRACPRSHIYSAVRCIPTLIHMYLPRTAYGLKDFNITCATQDPELPVPIPLRDVRKNTATARKPTSPGPARIPTLILQGTHPRPTRAQILFPSNLHLPAVTF